MTCQNVLLPNTFKPCLLHAAAGLNRGSAPRQAARLAKQSSVITGVDALHAKTVAALKKALPGLEATVAGSEAAAQDFFQFAFRYCLVVRVSQSRCRGAQDVATHRKTLEPRIPYLHLHPFIMALSPKMMVLCVLWLLVAANPPCNHHLQPAGRAGRRLAAAATRPPYP